MERTTHLEGGIDVEEPRESLSTGKALAIYMMLLAYIMFSTIMLVKVTKDVGEQTRDAVIAECVA